MTPRRIQRKRSKGWRLPPGAVIVTRPGKYGNPFRADQMGSKSAVLYFARLLTWREDFIRELWTDFDVGELLRVRNRILADIDELRGKDLVCWCAPGEPCHADILLELANA